MPKTAAEVFRDFVVPGDPSSGVHNPAKADIREVFGGVYTARDQAEQWADVALSVAGSGTIYTTRAALAAAVTAGTYPDGTIAYVQGRRYRVDPIGPDRLVAIDMDFGGQLDMLKSRMMDGQTVTLCAYGDSTTDGNQSTGWTANPTNPDGTAVGTAAHDPANAWPAVARSALRAMFGNTGIRVWNAGYGGKDIVSGWARRNFAQAVISNPAYGTPDAVVLNFGLNDMVRPEFNPDLFYTELRYMLSLLDYYGVVPVIATPDPVSQGTARQGGSLARLIVMLQRAARDFGVDIIDAHDGLADVFSTDGSNARWAILQPDGLHGQDAWQRMKGMFIAASLFPNTLWLDDGQEIVNVAPWDRSANTHNLTYSVYDATNNGFGGNINVTAGSYTVGQVLVDLWVWTLHPDRHIYWHSVDGDGFYHPRPLADAPKLVNMSYLNGASASTTSPTAGQVQGAANLRGSETPSRVGRLYPGVSRVQFLAPSDHNTGTVYVGYFSFRVPSFPASYVQAIPATGAGNVIYDRDPHQSKPLIACGNSSGSMDMMFEVALPVSAGVFLMAERVFGPSTSATLNNKVGLMLFRDGSGNAALWKASFDDTGASQLIGGAPVATAAYTWTGNDRFRLRMQTQASGQQEFYLFAGWQGNTALMTVQTPKGQVQLPWGGRPGVFFKNFTTAGGGGAVLTIHGINN